MAQQWTAGQRLQGFVPTAHPPRLASCEYGASDIQAGDIQHDNRRSARCR
jgi:hypothetical protein